jgi:hypothetical protein
VTYNPPTVEKLTGDAKTNKDQLQLVGTTLPIVLPIVGIILAVGGVLLLRRPRGRPVPGTSSSDTETTEPDETREGSSTKAPETADASEGSPSDDDAAPAGVKPGDSAEPADT